MSMGAHDSALGAVESSLRDVDFASLEIPDVMERLSELRARGEPVVPVRFHEEVAWIVLGYEAVSEAFMKEAELPAAAFFERYALPYMGRSLKTMRGDSFRSHRTYFGAPLLPARIRERVSSVLLPIANEIIDSFGNRRELDFMEAFARLYPFKVITFLLDLPAADNEMIHRYVTQLFRFPWDPEAALTARDAMIAYLRPYMKERRRTPGADIISYLATTTVEGNLMEEDQLLDFIRHLYPAAGENTSNGFGLLLCRVLSDDMTHRRVLASSVDRAAAVEEALRIDPPVPMIIRFTEHQVTIAGRSIPQGHPVLLAIGSANRDPKYFANPDEFSLDRGTINHITFGRGPRFCLGTHLARAELRVMLDLMLNRLSGLRLVDPRSVRIRGGLQRGPEVLRIAFDEVLPAPPIDA
jgi:pulcherriminic acid synthase